nr:RecName: Full=Large ribosomal subunit protein P2; AltName: Full=60S acidic ribosomal protein P2 [Pseudotsuga menziesii]
DITEVIAAGR